MTVYGLHKYHLKLEGLFQVQLKPVYIELQ